ncbi:MAG: YMGG-like glycine zipper-containing protein [Desulfobaccales bacterium]|nr:YMGG-like glycine zipper-containing protein [Desulfobaccales bacterium]
MNKWQRLFGRKRAPRLLVALLLALSFLTGCASQNPYMYTGAGLGAALGAGLGAAINNRNPWKGAAIGGLLGAAGGGVAGEVYGRSNPSPQRQGYYYPPNYSPPQQPGYSYAPPPNQSYN